MTVPEKTAGDALRMGVVVAARGDAQLLDATLRAIAALPVPPDRLVLVAQKGREHLADELSRTIQGLTVVSAEGRDNSWISLGLSAVAPDVDVTLFVTEGVLLGRLTAQRMRDQFADWQDVVAAAGIVTRAAKVAAGTSLSNIAALLSTPETALTPWLRRLFRARSLMPCVFALRVATCASVRPPQLPEDFDWMSFALMLDVLAARGRTRVGFAPDSRALRFVPERRGRVLSTYALYARLSQLRELTERDPSRAGVARSVISARSEKLRLMLDQMLQFFSPSRRQRVIADFKEMWRARRDGRAVRRSVARDLREMQ